MPPRRFRYLQTSWYLRFLPHLHEMAAQQVFAHLLGTTNSRVFHEVCQACELEAAFLRSLLMEMQKFEGSNILSRSFRTD